MDLISALDVLNSRHYEGCNHWRIAYADCRPVVTDGSRWLTMLEAIALAESLVKAESKFPRLEEAIDDVGKTQGAT